MAYDKAKSKDHSEGDRPTPGYIKLADYNETNYFLIGQQLVEIIFCSATGLITHIQRRINWDMHNPMKPSSNKMIT